MQEAVYYSSNGGASEDSLNVWGNDVGYLKGKIDPYEGKIASIITVQLVDDVYRVGTHNASQQPRLWHRHGEKRLCLGLYRHR